MSDGVLVDSNVLLDVIDGNARWGAWSSRALDDVADADWLAINPLVYAEVSARFQRIEDLDRTLPESIFRRLPLPWAAGFLAGKAYVAYRRAGGARRSPLPDFYIGAHAAIAGMRLLTRDAGRYGRYFPKLELIAP